MRKLYTRQHVTGNSLCHMASLRIQPEKIIRIRIMELVPHAIRRTCEDDEPRLLYRAPLLPVSFKIPVSPYHATLTLFNTTCRIIDRATTSTFIISHLPYPAAIYIHLPYLTSAALLVDPGKRKLLTIPVRAGIKS